MAAPQVSLRVERLAQFLLDGPAIDGLGGELAGWLAGSPRFRAFAEMHREKIRKKLRGATDEQARKDVRAELRVAHLLLADRGTELAFEAYGSGRPGPDFTLAFRGERPCNLEVTRLRRPPDDEALANVLLAKLRQMPPRAPNVLVVATEAPTSDGDAFRHAALALRTRADRKDEVFFAGRGFDGTRAFYDRFLRLGAAVVWSETAAAAEARAAPWVNASARIPVPERALRACVTALRGP